MFGLHFPRQHPVGPYFADFACLEVRLIVELDGSQHGSTSGQRHDALRSDVLAAEGFEVMRFWDNDVLASTPQVLESIRNRVIALTRASRDLSRCTRER